MALLEVRDVTIHFGGIVALDGVPFAVEEGHISGLIGPNGAGKTAAYNVITRLYEPDTWSSMGRRSSGRLRRRHRRFDPEKGDLITAATQHSKTEYNFHEGTEVTGSPETVLLRGNVLVENGDLVAEPGVGQFVERAAFGQELLPAAAR